MRFPRFKQHPLLEDATAPPKISNPVLHHSSISFEESKKMHRGGGGGGGGGGSGSGSGSASGRAGSSGSGSASGRAGSSASGSASGTSGSASGTSGTASGNLNPFPTTHPYGHPNTLSSAGSTAGTTTSLGSSHEPSLELPMLDMNNGFSKLLEIVDTDYTQVPELSESPGDGPRASDPTRISAIEPPEMFTEDTKEWSPNTLNPEGIQAKFIPATPMRESSRRFSVRGGETELTHLTPPQEWKDWKALKAECLESSRDGANGTSQHESSASASASASASLACASPEKPAVPPKDLKPKRKDPKHSYTDAQANGAPVAVPYGAIAAPARSTSMRSSGSTLKAAFSSSSSPKDKVSTHPRVSSRRFSRELQLKQHLGESEKEINMGKNVNTAPEKPSSSTIEEYKLAISRLNEIRLLQIRQRDERIAQLEAMVMRQQQTSSAKFEKIEAALPDESAGDSSDSSSHMGGGTRGRIQNMRALFPIA